MLFALYALAYKDELTGLASRRALNTMALSLNNHYSLAMVDIDHFKRFNDTYGHDVGDQVLRLVAKKLSKVKGGGQVFRYGGEEFTIVFENKDIELVLPYLEEIRQKIDHYDIVLRNEGRKLTSKSDRETTHKPNPKVNITISIGVAEQHGETSFENTLKRADEALYKAKNNGRNCVFA
nr:GGDEF domain-containing protein [Shewanella schlegeliana]